MKYTDYKIGQVVDFAVGITESYAKLVNKQPGVRGKGKIIKIKTRIGKGPIYEHKPFVDYFIQHETIDAMGNKKYRVYVCEHYQLGKIRHLDTLKAARKENK